MGCSNHPSLNDFVQFIATALLGLVGFNPPLVAFNHWYPVPGNDKYVEKWTDRGENGYLRMERSANQNPDPKKPDYPHYSEFYDRTAHKTNYIYKDETEKKIETMWDAHYSKIDANGHKIHYGAHKTAQAVIDDLDAAINDLRSGRK